MERNRTRTPEELRAAGYLTLNEVVQKLADEGVFLGRSGVRTIRFYQQEGKIPRPLHAGKGNIAYYAPQTLDKIVALRVKRMAQRGIAQHNAARLRELYSEDREGERAEAAGQEVLLPLYPSAEHTKEIEQLTRRLRDMYPEATNEGEQTALSPHGWTDSTAYLTWVLIRNYEALHEFMLTGDLERANRLIALSCRVYSNAMRFLEQHFRKKPSGTSQATLL